MIWRNDYNGFKDGKGSEMKTSLILITLMLATIVFAEWPIDPDDNLLICNRNGEQVVPKIAATSDGGCYVSWEDNGSGNYDIYLQRINPRGEILWQQNGILVDGHTQDTWITDYDMTVDREDYCIIVCNDIRTDPSRNIYAYRISPDGESVWGADGIAISDNADFEPNPQVVATAEGNIVIAWEQDTTPPRLNLRKLNPAGEDLWASRTIVLTAQFGLTIPRLAAADSDNVILEYLVPRASGMYAIKHIKAQKFAADGQTMWGDTGVFVSTAGGLGPQMWPDIIPDGDGGAYCYWYDTHESNRHHVYVQHLLRNGGVAWTVNGVKTSLASTELQMSPALAQVPGTGYVVAFYMVTDLGQTTSGMGGQMLDFNGERVWGDNGIMYAQLGQQQQYYINAVPQDSGAMVVYLEFMPGSAVNALVKAIRVNWSGNAYWETSPRELCTVISGKSRLVATTNRSGQVLATWTDARSDANGDLYLQNVNPDGSLGDWEAPPDNPPSDFSLLSPEDSSLFMNGWVTPFVWHRSIDPDSGDQVRYNIHFRIHYQNGTIGDTLVTDLADTTADIFIDPRFVNLEPDVPIEWWVDAISGTDTVPSREIWTYIAWQETQADDPNLIPRNFAIESVYPNPFNAEARIRMAMPNEALLRLNVYDILGRQVMTLCDSRIGAGYHDFRIHGQNLASGIYLVRAEMDGRSSLIQRIVLLK